MGAPYNSFTFDNINSLTEGVYISGSSAFNAPERDVEMIAIPGRNGEFIRDNGRFNNIEVTYPCGVVGDSTDFKTKMQNIRNKLASKRGYCRLVDTYNPNEYRMGVFKDAIEVEPVAQNTAGEFEVMFNCKPQRFLISGESTIEVEDGDSINNPTPFDAQPMIMLEGEGVLNIGSYKIELWDGTLGVVDLNLDNEWLFNEDLIMPGDPIYVGSATWVVEYGFPTNSTSRSFTIDSATCAASVTTSGRLRDVTVQTLPSSVNFVCGTAQTHTETVVVSYSYVSGGTTHSYTDTLTFSVIYDGTNKISPGFSDTEGDFAVDVNKLEEIQCDSTVGSLGHPTYVDCELGEAYKIDNGTFISLNRVIDLGSDLPVLVPGENEITFDNTYTSVEIIPHWWVV